MTMVFRRAQRVPNTLGHTNFGSTELGEGQTRDRRDILLETRKVIIIGRPIRDFPLDES